MCRSVFCAPINNKHEPQNVTFRNRSCSKSWATGQSEGRHREFLDSESPDSIDYPSEFDEILFEHQRGMIPHVEFQFLTSQYRTSFGLLHPEVKKTLEVSDVQSERMQALVRKFEQDSKQLMAKLQTQRKTAEKNFHSSVVKLLDERQKEKLSDWTPSR